MSDLMAQRVRNALETLRLQSANDNLDHHLREASQRDLSALEFLDHLLADELTARKELSMRVRTKLAHFPTTKTLDSFDFDAQPSLDRRVINELKTLAFVERAETVALLGPPGVGKTHIAIGLGIKALEAGHRVYFLTAQDLLDQIRVAQLDGIPGHKQRHLGNVPVLIIDEIGYVEFDKTTATWFFQLLCQRYERRATIITSNRSFGQWGEIFPDTTLARRAARPPTPSQPRPEPQGRELPPQRQDPRNARLSPQIPDPGGFTLPRRNWVHLIPALTSCRRFHGRGRFRSRRRFRCGQRPLRVRTLVAGTSGHNECAQQ